MLWAYASISADSGKTRESLSCLFVFADYETFSIQKLKSGEDL